MCNIVKLYYSNAEFQCCLVALATNTRPLLRLSVAFQPRLGHE